MSKRTQEESINVKPIISSIEHYEMRLFDDVEEILERETEVS